MVSASRGFFATITFSGLSNNLADFDPKHHVGKLPILSANRIKYIDFGGCFHTCISNDSEIPIFINASAAKLIAFSESMLDETI